MAPRRSKRKAPANNSVNNINMPSNTVNSINMPNLSPQTPVNSQPLTVSTNNITSSNHTQNPIIHVQNFDGNNMQINFFIDQIKDLADTYNWNDKYTLMYTKSKLIGKAQVFVNQAQEIKKFENTEELFSKLRNFFKVQSLATNINDFHNFVILPQESIQNTAHRLDLIAHRVYKDMDNDNLEKIKFVKFLQVIPSNIRAKLLENNITTYPEAIEKAELMQNCATNNKILNCDKEENEKFDNLTHQINSLQASIEKIEKDKTENAKKRAKDKSHKNSDNHFHTKQRGNIGNVKRNFRAGRFNVRGRRNFRNYRGGNNYGNRNDNYRNNYHNYNKIQCQICDTWGHSAKFCNIQNSYQNTSSNHNLTNNHTFPALTNPIINHPN